MPSLHSDDEGSTASGSQFSEQFNGLTDSLPVTRSNRSSGNSKPQQQQKKNNDDAAPTPLAGMPGVPQQTKPLEIHLPTDGSGSPQEQPISGKKASGRTDALSAPVFAGTVLLTADLIGLAGLPAANSPRGSGAASDAQPTPPAAAVNSAIAATGMPESANAGEEGSSGQPNTGQSDATGSAAQAGGPAGQEIEDMAFAARVAPSNAAQQLSSQMTAASAAASAKKTGVGDAPADSSQLNANLLSQAAAAAFQKNGELNSAAPAQKPSAAPASAPDLEASQLDPAPKLSTPLKDISLQVTRPGSENVDVRVVQQAGEVRVAVHTGDSDLVHGLRQGLSDLVGRLEENGYRAETWRPVSVAAPVGSTSESAHTAGNSRNADSQSQPGWSQQDSGRRNQNQSNQPRWVEELESSMPAGGESVGDSHGHGN
jgi:hypothetical protein